MSKLALVGVYRALIENEIHLTKFIISGNQLQDDGISELLPLVLKSQKLQLLGMTGCRITVNSGQAFVDFLNF